MMIRQGPTIGGTTLFPLLPLKNSPCGESQDLAIMLNSRVLRFLSTHSCVITVRTRQSFWLTTPEGNSNKFFGRLSPTAYSQMTQIYSTISLSQSLQYLIVKIQYTTKNQLVNYRSYIKIVYLEVDKATLIPSPINTTPMNFSEKC